jgi:hypothetical protein
MEQLPKLLKLTYNGVDRSGKKIATLLKMARLNCEIEETIEEAGAAHILHTPSGELCKEYEIINYIIGQSRELSRGRGRDAKENTESRVEKETTSLTHLPEGDPP